MPRERITTCTPTGRNVETGEEVPPPPFDVEVTWHRDGNVVQVATTAADADERLRTWVEATGGTDRDCQPVPSAPATSFHEFTGWHVDLNRAAVNQLIRVLRTARDQTFGKDE